MRLLLLAALLAAFAVVSPPPAAAQENVPEWAAPPPPPTRAPNTQAQDAPPLPGDPNQVPVNGLLALLAIAGGAYAVRRLRQPAA